MPLKKFVCITENVDFTVDTVKAFRDKVHSAFMDTVIMPVFTRSSMIEDIGNRNLRLTYSKGTFETGISEYGTGSGMDYYSFKITNFMGGQLLHIRIDKNVYDVETKTFRFEIVYYEGNGFEIISQSNSQLSKYVHKTMWTTGGEQEIFHLYVVNGSSSYLYWYAATAPGEKGDGQENPYSLSIPHYLFKDPTKLVETPVFVEYSALQGFKRFFFKGGVNVGGEIVVDGKTYRTYNLYNYNTYKTGIYFQTN